MKKLLRFTVAELNIWFFVRNYGLIRDVSVTWQEDDNYPDSKFINTLKIVAKFPQNPLNKTLNQGKIVPQSGVDRVATRKKKKEKNRIKDNRLKKYLKFFCLCVLFTNINFKK